MISNLPDRIFLSGFMGAGKSTIGKVLAEKLDLPFVDLDRFIEKEAGASIATIFEEKGEAAFREKERFALLKLIGIFEGVMALGGGTLQNQHLVDHIKRNGLLIFIETPFSVILDRIINQAGRPLLMDEDGSNKSRDVLETEMKELYQQRLPLYEQAVIRINSSQYENLDMLSDQLIRKIKSHVSHY